MGPDRDLTWDPLCICSQKCNQLRYAAVLCISILHVFPAGHSLVVSCLCRIITDTYTINASQNVGKVTNIKGRLLDQAVILLNCVPIQNGNFS